MTPEIAAAAREKRARIVASEHAEPVVLKVKDSEHARSEEVLKFCLKELQAGTTYNALRCKLGCGIAAYDNNWRVIRASLAEMIMPRDEEEALLSSNALSAYLLNRMEEFANTVKNRAAEMKGDKMEFQYWKLELDALKMLTERQEARTEHYLKMKAIQKAESKLRGQTIVYNNKFYIPRPGEQIKDVDITPSEAAQLVGRLEEIESGE